MKTVWMALALLVASAAPAQVKPGFEPNDVVRQVRSSHSTTGPLDHSATGLDDGEFLLDTIPVYEPATDMQWYSSVAYGGGNYLVVWQDWRSDYPNYIYCARVRPDGDILDPAGVVIASTLEQDNSTAVAFDGANFLVVWEDARGNSAMDIYGARVSPGGAVLDPGGFPVSISQENQFNPAVAFRSPNFLVVWDDWRGSTRGTRVTRAGVVLDPDGIAISTLSSSLCNPRIATDGTNFLVVWERQADGYIFGTRVRPDGVVLDSNGIRISFEEEREQHQAVAFDGTNYFVVWYGWTDRDGHDMRGARITPGGVVLDTAGIAISSSLSWDEPPAIAFGDTTFMVVWRAYGHHVLCARVTRAGIVLDSNGITIATNCEYEGNSRIASDGTDFLAVWVGDLTDEPYDICGARVSGAGVVLDSGGFAISTAARRQVTPVAASDSTNFLVVWEEKRNGNTDIYGARVSPAGVILDPDGFSVSTSSDTQGRPTVAFDGTNHLVVWEQYLNPMYSDIYGARVSRDGVVLDTHAIAISTAEHRQRYPAVAFDGTGFLVAWEDWRNSPLAVFAARVSSGGTVLDPDGIRVSSTLYEYEPLTATSDGTNSLVVWCDVRNADVDVYGARLSPGGVVLDTDGIRISSAMSSQRSPSTAFDGSNFFVAWDDERSGVDYDLYGARVNPAGILIDTMGIAISTAPEDQDHPAVEFDGTNVIAVWQDERNDYAPDLYGAFVSPSGSVFGSGAVVTAPGFQSGPSLARGSGSQMFLAYQGWTGTVGGRPYNSDRIWGKMNPHPGVEEVENGEVRRVKGGATIVRGVLDVSLAAFRDGKPGQSTTGQSLVFLLDIAGRKVMKLHPGPNDVSRLAPGVYFVRTAVGGQRSASHKVVVQR